MSRCAKLELLNRDEETIFSPLSEAIWFCLWEDIWPSTTRQSFTLIEEGGTDFYLEANTCKLISRKFMMTIEKKKYAHFSDDDDD